MRQHTTYLRQHKVEDNILLDQIITVYEIDFRFGHLMEIRLSRREIQRGSIMYNSKRRKLSRK